MNGSKGYSQTVFVHIENPIKSTNKSTKTSSPIMEISLCNILSPSQKTTTSHNAECGAHSQFIDYLQNNSHIEKSERSGNFLRD